MGGPAAKSGGMHTSTMRRFENDTCGGANADAKMRSDVERPARMVRCDLMVRSNPYRLAPRRAKNRGPAVPSS